MATNTIRIGIVGAGRFSNIRVLPELKKIPGVELVAVANSRRETSERVAQEQGVGRVAADWKEVVSADDVDLVFNGTQAPQHHDILLAALENDKHVFTMNPLAMTAAEAQEIVRAAQARPHLKMRQYLAFPHGPYPREDAVVLRLLEEGRIGRVLHASLTWHTPFLALGSYFEVLNRWLGDHRRVLGFRKQYEIEGKRAGVTTTLAELAEGATITYTHNTLISEPARGPRAELYGEEGTLIVHANPESPRESIFIGKRGGTDLEPVAIPADLGANWDDPRFVNVEEQFIEWVQGGAEPTPLLIKPEDGLKSLEFAEGFVASMKQGSVWVDLPQH